MQDTKDGCMMIWTRLRRVIRNLDASPVYIEIEHHAHAQASQASSSTLLLYCCLTSPSEYHARLPNSQPIIGTTNIPHGHIPTYCPHIEATSTQQRFSIDRHQYVSRCSLPCGNPSSSSHPKYTIMLPYFPSRIDLNNIIHTRPALPATTSATPATPATMLARRTYSSGCIRQRADSHQSSNTRPTAATHQTNNNNLNPSRRSNTLRSNPIVISRNLTIYPTPGSPPPYTWDTDTLVDDEFTVPIPGPSNYSDLAPQHISDINARGRMTWLRLHPRAQLAPIVYGNGRWVLQPRLRTSGHNVNINRSGNNGSIAQQALAGILLRQPPAIITTATTADLAERPDDDEQRPRTEDEQIAFVQRFLVEMGYSYARQRTLQYEELNALEQHRLALRIMAEVATATGGGVGERRDERRLPLPEEEGEVGGEDGRCCTRREYERGVACEMCMLWGGEIWRV